MIKYQSDTSRINKLEYFKMLDLSDITGTGSGGTLGEKWNSIIFITGGNGILQIDFDEFIALEYRVFLIEKYKVWKWLRINNKLTGFLVQFTDSFYNHIYTGNPILKSDQTIMGEIPPFIKISHGERTEWKSIFEILNKEFHDKNKNSEEIICLILKILILMYRRNSLMKTKIYESGQKKQLLNEFRKLVNNGFISLRTSKDYASILNITPNYLNALCQEFFMKTVSEIIRERVILEAKRLLMHSNLSISEIGYKLGFKDNSYFGRYFNKAVGMTPKKYRDLCF